MDSRWAIVTRAWAAAGQLQRLGGNHLLVRFTALDTALWETVIDWLEGWACEDGWVLSYADGLQDELPLRGGGPAPRCTSCRRFERPNWISAGPGVRVVESTEDPLWCVRDRPSTSGVHEGPSVMTTAKPRDLHSSAYGVARITTS